jgi:hypothetical protein
MRPNIKEIELVNLTIKSAILVFVVLINRSCMDLNISRPRYKSSENHMFDHAKTASDSYQRFFVSGCDVAAERAKRNLMLWR